MKSLEPLTKKLRQKETATKRLQEYMSTANKVLNHH